MKVQGAKKVHYDSGPNMTPLVDVVYQAALQAEYTKVAMAASH